MKALLLAIVLTGIVSARGPGVPPDAICLATGGSGSTYMTVGKDGGSWVWWEEDPSTCNPPVKLLCVEPGTTREAQRWIRVDGGWVKP